MDLGHVSISLFLLSVLAATIGLGGVQLFVDAGIPVDRDLVSNLIREVIAENISTILGHPKPKAMPLSSKVSKIKHFHFHFHLRVFFL